MPDAPARPIVRRALRWILLAALLADGVPLHPHPDALHFAQDKLAMRERLTALGIPCPRWAAVADEAELRAFGDEAGWPVVLKTPRGGYDGKGVRVVGAASEAADWFARLQVDPQADGRERQLWRAWLARSQTTRTFRA